MERAAGSTKRYAVVGGGLAAAGFAVGAFAGDWAALIGAVVGEGVAVAAVAAVDAGRRRGGVGHASGWAVLPAPLQPRRGAGQ